MRKKVTTFSTFNLCYDSRLNVLSFLELVHLNDVRTIHFDYCKKNETWKAVFKEFEYLFWFNQKKKRKSSATELFFYFSEDSTRKLYLYPCKIELRIFSSKSLTGGNVIQLKNLIPRGCKNLEISSTRIYRIQGTRRYISFDLEGTNLYHVGVTGTQLFQESFVESFKNFTTGTRGRDFSSFKHENYPHFGGCQLKLSTLHMLMAKCLHLELKGIVEVKNDLLEDEEDKNEEENIFFRMVTAKTKSLNLEFDSPSVIPTIPKNFFTPQNGINDVLIRLKISQLKLKSNCELESFLTSIRIKLPVLRFLHLVNLSSAKEKVQKKSNRNNNMGDGMIRHPIEILLHKNQNLKIFETDLCGVVHNHSSSSEFIQIDDCWLEKIIFFLPVERNEEDQDDNIMDERVVISILQNCSKLYSVGFLSYRYRVPNLFQNFGSVIDAIPSNIREFLLLSPSTPYSDDIFEKIFSKQDHIEEFSFDGRDNGRLLEQMLSLDNPMMTNLRVLNVNNHSVLHKFKYFMKRPMNCVPFLQKSQVLSLAKNYRNLDSIVLGGPKCQYWKYYLMHNRSGNRPKLICCDSSYRSYCDVNERDGLYRDKLMYDEYLEELESNFLRSSSSSEDSNTFYQISIENIFKRLVCKKYSHLDSSVQVFPRSEKTKKKEDEELENENENEKYYIKSKERWGFIDCPSSSIIQNLIEKNHCFGGELNFGEYWEKYYKTRKNLEDLDLGDHMNRSVEESFRKFVRTGDWKIFEKEKKLQKMFLDSFYSRCPFLWDVEKERIRSESRFYSIYDTFLPKSNNNNKLYEIPRTIDIEYSLQSRKDEFVSGSWGSAENVSIESLDTIINEKFRISLFSRKYHRSVKAFNIQVISEKGLDFLKYCMFRSHDVMSREMFLRMIFTSVGIIGPSSTSLFKRLRKNVDVEKWEIQHIFLGGDNLVTWILREAQRCFGVNFSGDGNVNKKLLIDCIFPM